MISRRSDFSLVAGAAVAAAGLGALETKFGAKTLVVALVPIAAVLASDRRARAIFIVFGGLVTFQSSAGLTALKVGYIIGVGVCAVVAVLGRKDDRTVTTVGLRLASTVIMVVVILGLLVAYFNHHSATTTLRDSVNYVLLALVPLLARDMASTGVRFCSRLLLAAGAYGTLGFFLEWTSRRGYLSVSGIGLASLPLVAALVSYVCAQGLTSRRSLRWLALACIVFAILFATGSRSSLIMIVAPAAIAAIRLRRAYQLVPLVLGAVICVLGAIQLGLISDTATSRVLSFAGSGAQGTEQSNSERGAARADATSLINQSPLLGSGLGTEFIFAFPGATVVTSHDDISADTFLVTPAKFGWPGALALSAAVLAMLLIPLAQRGFTSVAGLAGFGLGVTLIALGLIMSPLDDKGLAFGVLLLVAIGMAEESQSSGWASQARSTATTNQAGLPTR